jgi:hypothetical protein
MLLDEAERGQAVVVERKGVRFRIDVEQPVTRRTRATRIFEHVDHDVTSGSWTWTARGTGLSFRPRRR